MYTEHFKKKMFLKMWFLYLEDFFNIFYDTITTPLFDIENLDEITN